MATFVQFYFVLLAILLRQYVYGQDLINVDVDIETPEPRYGEWTQWSTCTTSTQSGVRVRSRACEIGSCNRISGGNYEVQKCTPEASNATVQNQAFLDKCTRDPAMNNTLSCRLYRENPIMAYGIYKSAEEMACDHEGKPLSDGRPKRCLFNLINDQNQNELPRQPQTIATSLSQEITQTSLLKKMKNSMKISKACKESCTTSLGMTSGVNARSANTAMVDEVLEQAQQSVTAKNHNGGFAREFDNCLQKCRKSKSFENNRIRSGTDESRRKRKLLSSIFSSANSGKFKNKELLRKRRSIPAKLNPENYRSPCFERTDYSISPRVINLDNSDGELYFYEGLEQRFVRKRCAGREMKTTRGLFHPIETVRQEKTNMNALCKQEYLQRNGLLIQLDSRGEFAFNNGERFSVRFRSFKLESHCTLSTYQPY